MVIRPCRPDEWRELRELRLRALQDAPDVFGATFAEESVDPDEAWQRRANRPDGIMVVAVDEAGRFAGMASGGLAPEEMDSAAIYGMWVEPAVRGQRIGEALIGVIASWAQSEGHERIGLGVTIGNDAAAALYERLGFEDTGLRFPLREGTDLTIRILVAHVDDLAAYFAP
jgi:ribosomal protein S18 acetylase RimI-like enzyme